MRDRFKIFIIDEAHMVTREGFNALLEIVEEPPEPSKFIFAFCNADELLVYVGLADMMQRNLDRRVKALVRITDLLQLVSECAR